MMKTFPLAQQSEFKTIALTDESFFASKQANDTVENMQQQSSNQVLKMKLNEIEKLSYEKNDDVLNVKFKTNFKALPFTFEKPEDIPQFLSVIKSDTQFTYSEKKMSVLEATKNNIILLVMFWIFSGMLLFFSRFGNTDSGGKIGLFLRIVNLIKDKLGNMGLYAIIVLLILFPVWFLYRRIKYKPVKITLKNEN